MTDKGYPAKMSSEDHKLDQFTDSGSDNQNKFELKVGGGINLHRCP